MNAISQLAPGSAGDVSFSSMVSNLAPEQAVAGFHERMRIIAEVMLDFRRETARLRHDSERIDYGATTTDDLDASIAGLAAQIGRLRTDRRLTEQLVRSMRSNMARSGRGYLRPALDRIANTVDMGLAERLDLIREVRSRAIQEYGLRDPDPTGVVFETPAGLRAYLEQELAN